MIYLPQLRGDSFNHVFQLLNDDEATPINLYDTSVKLSIGNVVSESTSGVTIDVDEAQGMISILVSNTVMEALTDSEYPIAVKLLYNSENILETIFSGTLVMEANP